MYASPLLASNVPCFDHLTRVPGRRTGLLMLDGPSCWVSREGAVPGHTAPMPPFASASCPLHRAAFGALCWSPQRHMTCQPHPCQIPSGLEVGGAACGCAWLISNARAANFGFLGELSDLHDQSGAHVSAPHVPGTTAPYLGRPV